MVASGAHDHALVVGSDVMSSIIDYKDRSTCVLFGDGAGACVVSVAEDESRGVILDFEHEIDGSGGEALCMPAGGSRQPPSHKTVEERLHYVKQDGQTVFRFAVRKTEEISRRIMERNGITPDDIDLFVSHQANRRIIQSRRLVEEARIALGAVGPKVYMVPTDALVGKPLTDETIAAAGQAAKDTATPIDDMRGSVKQRKHLSDVLTQRTIRRAAERARG